MDKLPSGSQKDKLNTSLAELPNPFEDTDLYQGWAAAGSGLR